jgi:hypothetical protein
MKPDTDVTVSVDPDAVPVKLAQIEDVSGVADDMFCTKHSEIGCDRSVCPCAGANINDADNIREAAVSLNILNFVIVRPRSVR